MDSIVQESYNYHMMSKDSSPHCINKADGIVAQKATCGRNVNPLQWSVVGRSYHFIVVLQKLSPMLFADNSSTQALFSAYLIKDNILTGGKLDDMAREKSQHCTLDFNQIIITNNIQHARKTAFKIK